MENFFRMRPSRDQELVEAEMLRHVSRISLLQDSNIDALEWTERDSIETNDNIKLLEDIINNGIGDKDGDSSAQNNVAFDQLTRIEKGSSIATAATVESVSSVEDSEWGSPATPSSPSALSHGLKERMQRKYTEERRFSRVVASICAKLRSSKKKIVHNIEINPEDDMCGIWLHLNDMIADVLSRAEFLVPQAAENFVEDDDDVSGLDDSLHNTSRRSLSEETPMSGGGAGGGNNDQLTTRRQPSMNSILYMLHRPCDRRETRKAVNQLIQRLHATEGDARVAAIREMKTNCTLQTLLSALPRCTEWPEVEIQITAAISVLVTYEDDRQLLQRSAVDILTSLFMLQLKASSRVRSRYQTLLIEQTMGEEPVDIETDAKRAEDSLEYFEVRILVSSALTKLAAVLCDEWMKIEEVAQGPGFDFAKFLNLDISNSGSMAAPAGRHRSLSNSTRQEKDSSSSTFSRCLETILNLIFTICEPATQEMISKSNPSVVSSPVGNTNAMKRRNHSLSPTSPLSPIATPSKVSPRLKMMQTVNANLPASQSLPALLHPSDARPVLNAAISLPLSDDTVRSWGVAALNDVDTACVTCSLCLCFLAEVPHCRLSLVSGGALALLRKWMDLATDVLTQISLRIDQEAGGRSRAQSWMSPDTVDEDSIHLKQLSEEIEMNKKSGQVASTFELESFVGKCRLAGDLINNVSAAIMYLLGGQPDNSQASYRGSESFVRQGKSGPNGQDYVIGRIDAHFMNEGVPSSIVKFILKAIEVEENKLLLKFCETMWRKEGLSPMDDDAFVTATKDLTLFTHAARINLSQALWQLSSRSQNRHQLANIGTSLTISALFIFAVSTVGASGEHDKEERGPPCKDDKLTALRVRLSGLNKSPHTSRSTVSWSTNSGVGQCAEVGKSLSQFPEYSCSQVAQVFFSGNNINTSRTMILISTACLNALNYFLADSRQTKNFGTTSAASSSSALAQVQSNVSLNSALGSSASTQSLPAKVPPMDMSSVFGSTSGYSFIVGLMNSEGTAKVSSGSYLVDCMCHPQMVDSLKFLLAFLPRGTARLATLHVISSLSEWPKALDVLFSRDLTDALVLISSEAVELKRLGSLPATGDESCRDVPTPRERKSFDDTLTRKSSLFATSPGSRKSHGSAFKPSTPSSSSAFGHFHSGSVPTTPITPNSVSSDSRRVPKPNPPIRSVSAGSPNVLLPEPKRPGGASRGKLSPIVQGRPVSGASSISAVTIIGNNNPQLPRHIGIFGTPTDKPLYSLSIPSTSPPLTEDRSSVDKEGKDVNFEAGGDLEELPEEITPEMEVEETMTVTYILGNFCHRNPRYTERVFDNGILQIVLPLVKSKNVEVGRNALRCVSAACSVIASAPTDRVGATRQQKSQLYRDVLSALSSALLVPNSYLQSEAVEGIANLSEDSSLHLEIIAGPFRCIVGLLIEHNTCNPETRASSEIILKNLGFSNAIGDLEICFYDADVMIDWFSFRKALLPQSYARKLLRKWISELFRISKQPRKSNSTSGKAEEKTEEAPLKGPVKTTTLQREESEGVSSNDEYDADDDLAAGAVEALEFVNDASRSLRNSIHHTNSLNFMTDIQKVASESRDDVLSSGTAAISASLSSISRHFSDPNMSVEEATSNSSSTGHHNHHHGHFSFFGHNVHFADFAKYLPFCLNRNAALEILKEEEAEARGPSPIHMVTTHPSSLPSVRAGMGDTTSNSNAVKAKSDTEELFGMNAPPNGVTDLLHVFFPSKLHQQFFIDITSLQPESVLLATEEALISTMPNNFATSSLFDNSSGESNSSTAMNLERLKRSTIKLPSPHAVSGIYFSPRAYSFERIRRVVERMVDEGGPEKRWSLGFRDDSFAVESMTDFYGALVPMLCRFSNIVCLSVTNSILVKDPLCAVSTASLIQTAHLGHMIGNVPPSIRFVNLSGVLSSESIQALTILLRKQNFCFSKPVSANDPVPSSDAVDQKRGKGVPAVFRKLQLPTKGLLGLAITHTQFSMMDVEHLIELLQVYPPAVTTGTSLLSALGGGRKRSSKSGSHYHNTPANGEDLAMLRFKLQTGGCPRGIRFLDVSYNKFNDGTCADILRASALGPLEGLDLSGNVLLRGSSFVDVFAELMAESSFNALRHISLANSSLHYKAVCSILDCLNSNRSLTSLDLSGNDIRHSDRTKDAIRHLLKRNRGLRRLDLSNNKLTVDTMQSVYLGMLENETLVLFALMNNCNVHLATEMPYIQDKLRDNRQRYASCIDMYNQSLKNIQKRAEKVAIAAAAVMTSTTSTKTYSSSLPTASFNLGSRIRSPLGSTAAEISAAGGRRGEFAHPLEADVPVAMRIEKRGSERAVSTTSESDSCRLSDLAHDDQYPPMAVAVLMEDGTNEEYISVERTQARILSSASSDSATEPLPPLVPASVINSPSSAANVSSSANPSHRKADSSVPETPHSDRSELRAPLTPLVMDGNYDESSTPITARSTNSVSVSTATQAGSDLKAGGFERINSDGSNSNLNVLNVFFSAPLAWRDRSNRFHPLEMLDYASERDALIQVMREVHRDIAISFDFATTDALRTALSFGCRALHFSGHGHPQCLNFEDGRAGLQLVTVDTLRSLLRAGGLKLDFVFVSACHSRKTGEAFVEAGVPHVVCVKVDAMIQDSAASAFTRAFYLALLSGKTVQESFDIAREALKASPYVPDSLLEGEKFVLLPDSSSLKGNESLSHCTSIESMASASEVDSPNDSNFDTALHGLHDVPIFKSKLVGEWPQSGHIRMGKHHNIHNNNYLSSDRFDTASESGDHNSVVARYFDGVVGASGSFFGSNNHTLPIPPPDFEGREVDMYRVITTLLTRRLVTLVGDVGVGKTSITAAICTYVADRAMFLDGVLYLRLQMVSHHCGFLSTLLRGLASGPPKVAARLEFLKASSMSFSQAFESCCVASPASGGDTPANPPSNSDLIYFQEQLIVTCLTSLRVLLVLDQIDNLLISEEEAATDMKVFLGRLFDRCRHVKVLITATETLSSRRVSGFGVVENCVTLGPLTLRSSIRLFARLAPPLISSAHKAAFVAALLPPKNSHVTATSRDLTVCTSQLLKMVGNGHPALIVKIACASTQHSIQECMKNAQRIMRESNSPPLMSSPSPFSLPPTARLPSPTIPLALRNSLSASSVDMTGRLLTAGAATNTIEESEETESPEQSSTEGK